MIVSPLLAVSILFATLYLLMVLYFFIGWLRLKKGQGTRDKEHAEQPFVSVIIPTRNESENIKACLESIFKQNYPKHRFEVIVIDDYSTDPTLRLAREFNEDNLTVLDLQQYLGNPGEYVPNKKKAIALGIKNAKGELIVTTDGDCVRGENWLSTMVNYYLQHDYKLLTGPVMLKPAKWPLQVFQQLDVMNLLGITGATIRNGAPVMCNGANLLYAKETFQEVEGYKGNNDIPTGDDIFLMQKIEAKYPGSVGFVKDFDACVFPKPEKGFAKFISQRIRWISKATGFSNWRITTTLYFAYLFNALIPVTVAFTFPVSEWSWLPLAVVGGTKLFADFLFNIPVTIFFRKWYLLFVLPIVEVFHVLYVLLIGPLSLLGSYRWKDRLVR
ncbi:MAG: glycosyltransferase [Chitinophagales bacterium]|nr:glycosyltransferase [Chitinophagales bacterium]